MKKSILFVDDEPNILDGIQRMIRTKRGEWDVAFAGSGPEALRRMEERPFDLVVSDMRMPIMDGTQLMAIVMAKYPDTIRFILSGFADQELILKSIGSTHQFLSKPCDTTVLIHSIERALAVRDYLKKDSLKRLVTQIKSIPSLPDLYLQVVEELKSPNASTQRVGQIISKDIGMSAKLLQLVNSAFFGLSRRVSDPAQAASLLGLDILKSVVLMMQVFSQMNQSLPEGWSLESLWDHSLWVARGSQLMAKHAQVDKKSVDDAFMAGLFHDLGKLVLAANLPEKYKEVMTLNEVHQNDLLEAERQVLGGTHEEVGAYLLGLWGFSDSLIEAAAFHHRPSDSLGQTFTVLTAVHVANVWVNELRPSRLGSQKTRLDLAYMERIGCADCVPEWMAVCEANMEQEKEADGNDSVR